MPTRTDELALTSDAAGHDDDGGDDARAAEWIRAAKAGDAAAFGRLVERHERMVLRTALRLLGRMEEAQDAAQEAFLRMHKYLERFDESRDLGPWLYRLVVNACHDLASRRRGARLVPLDDLRDAEHPTSRTGPDEIEQALTAAEQRRLIADALTELPEKERAVIVLRDLEGLSTGEVARILGSSEGTVRSQASTGRLKIKAFVEKQQRRGR